MDNHSFCESVYATPYSRWHIRKLTKAGKKYGGGADSFALCGRRVDWDMEVELTDFHLKNNSCQECLKIYLKD